MTGVQAEEEDELELNYEENDSTMDVDPAQRGATEAPYADRTALFDYTGRIMRVLEDDSAARCMAAQVNGQRQGHNYVCFGYGQLSDDHPSDGVHTFDCTTCAASIGAACAAEAMGDDLSPRKQACSGEGAELLEAPRDRPILPQPRHDAKRLRCCDFPPGEHAGRDMREAPSNYTTPAELLSSTCASTHRWGNTSCRTYIKSYRGSKDHFDACGCPVSSPMHYANRAHGAQLDLLAARPIDDKARKWHELHGCQPPANPSQPYPDRHHMEAYLVDMLTWH
eukprot:jgi/Tetstr1/447625/TSEL_034986.t1